MYQNFCGAPRQRCATEFHISVAHPANGAPQNFLRPMTCVAARALSRQLPNLPSARTHETAIELRRRPPHAAAFPCLPAPLRRRRPPRAAAFPRCRLRAPLHHHAASPPRTTTPRASPPHHHASSTTTSSATSRSGGTTPPRPASAPPRQRPPRGDPR